MPILELFDDEIKADILNKLARRRCWGERYAQVQKITGSLVKRIKKDGQRVVAVINDLVDGGFTLIHKGGRTISLNPRRS